MSLSQHNWYLKSLQTIQQELPYSDLLKQSRTAIIPLYLMRILQQALPTGPNNKLENYHSVLTALAQIIIAYLIITITSWKIVEECNFHCFTFNAAFSL